MATNGQVVARIHTSMDGTVEVPFGANTGSPAYTGWIDACQNEKGMGRGTKYGPQPWCAMSAAKAYRDAGCPEELWRAIDPYTGFIPITFKHLGVDPWPAGRLVPPGAIVVAPGRHVEICVADRGDGLLDCVGGNVNNQVDLTEMLAMLNNQAFDTIVLRAQFYPPPVLDAIGQQYETTDLVQMNGFVYCIMRPR